MCPGAGVWFILFLTSTSGGYDTLPWLVWEELVLILWWWNRPTGMIFLTPGFPGRQYLLQGMEGGSTGPRHTVHVGGLCPKAS